MKPGGLLRVGFERLENLFGRAFGPAWNPFYQLGALGWFFYWIVAVTGVYLFVFFDTGITNAYQSVEEITHAQWFAGGVMRSLHRYASDAMIVVMTLHLVREWVYGRLRGARWFSWVTGIPAIWFVFGSGITGYWLVWDQLAQYIAITTSEWLDALPIFGGSVMRNFVNSENLSDRFFTLMVFMHIAVPLFLLLVMWIHIQRVTNSRINPPRGLAIGSLITLTALSFAYPALSQGPANLDRVASVVRLDWYYLNLYPLLDSVSGAALWIALVAASVLLTALPWLPPARREAPAVVDLANCNGCGRCAADCPYTAITMRPRTDGLPFSQEAEVDDGLCLRCGICAGACPTATPFRRKSELIPGIDLPALPIRVLREQTLAAAAPLAGEGRVLVFGCRHGSALDPLRGPAVATIALPCLAHLPPAFLDFVITGGHADGVLLAGCRAGDCHYRLGDEWTRERVAGRRDPMLRARVPRARLRLCWVGQSGATELREQLASFRTQLGTLGPFRRAETAPASGEVNHA